MIIRLTLSPNKYCESEEHCVDRRLLVQTNCKTVEATPGQHLSPEVPRYGRLSRHKIYFVTTGQLLGFCFFPYLTSPEYCGG